MSCCNFCGCAWRIIDTSKPKQVETYLPEIAPNLSVLLGEPEFCNPESEIYDRELCSSFRGEF